MLPQLNHCTRNPITAIDSKFKNEMRKGSAISGNSEQKMWEEKIRFIRMIYNIECTFFLPHSDKLSTNGAIVQSLQKFIEMLCGTTGHRSI